MVVSKGILNGSEGQDISKTGISVPAGMQEEGVDLMKFISFESYKEVSAWGYDNFAGKGGLEIAPWAKNTETKSVLDQYSNDGAFDGKGIRRFHVHTHPGKRDGTMGLGYPSRSDMTNNSLLPSNYYIISRKHGLTQYDPKVLGGNPVTPLKTGLPASLKKYVK